MTEISVLEVACVLQLQTSYQGVLEEKNNTWYQRIALYVFCVWYTVLKLAA